MPYYGIPKTRIFKQGGKKEISAVNRDANSPIVQGMRLGAMLKADYDVAGKLVEASGAKVE